MIGAATFKWAGTRTGAVAFATAVTVASAVCFLFWICVASTATWFARFAGAISGRRTWSGSMTMARMWPIASRILTSQITSARAARATTPPVRALMFAVVVTLRRMRRLLHRIWTIFTVFAYIGAISIVAMNRLVADRRWTLWDHATCNIVDESFGITESASFAIRFATCGTDREKRKTN